MDQSMMGLLRKNKNVTSKTNISCWVTKTAISDLYVS